jgi:signal transduction histidine kinase
LAARQPTPLPRQVTDGLARIDSTVLRMTRMIDDLLDVTQLELGRPLDLDRQRVDLVDLSRRIVAEHQHRTDKHLIRVAGEPELVGDWDRPRLERVLDNLLSNAVKYSPDGGVITVVVAHEEDETGSWAILSVRDQGVGIPAADLPRIFERYHRAQNVGRTGGRGIGLAVIREIVERHAGSISVESYEGQGSTFTIRLPLCTP